MKITSNITKIKKRKHNFDVNLLDSLVQDENSCIEIKNLNHHLALHPFHLNDLTDSVKELLGQGISKYKLEFDGILFGYKNIKLLSEVGKICDDSHFIHIDVEADFYIFKPEVGKLLQGVVNKKSQDHVGCLVHQTFNVSLPKPEHEEEWLGSSLTLNSKVLIKITYTDFEGKLPYIRGEIVSILEHAEGLLEYSTMENSHSEKKKRKKIIFEDENNELDEAPKPKKRKKSKSFADNSTLEAASIIKVNEDTASSKKSKKKRKSDNNDEDTMESSNLDTPIALNSEPSEVKHKKKKKSKV